MEHYVQVEMGGKTAAELAALVENELQIADAKMTAALLRIGNPRMQRADVYADKVLELGTKFFEAEKLTSRWDVINRLAPRVDRWLLAALRLHRMGSDSTYVLPIQALLGNRFYMAEIEERHPASAKEEVVDATTWSQLKAICLDELQQIAQAGEAEIYASLGMSDVLGSLGSEFFDAKVRIDAEEVLGPEVTREVVSKMSSLMGWGDEAAAVYLMWFLNIASDDIFQEAVRNIVHSEGLEGEHYPAPPKNCQRMKGKLEADHAAEASPKAAANIDGVRCALTFEDVESIGRGFGAIVQHMRPLRVKNNYRTEFEASKETFGYRCLLVNVLLTQESSSWGAVIDDAEPKLRAAIKRYALIGGDPDVEGTLTSMLDVLRTHEGFRTRPFAYVAEVQIIHRKYLQMRKRSHLFYKIHRPVDWIQLVADFRRHSPV